MATNDFVHDLLDKLVEEKIEYVVITVQKGKKDHKSSAYFNLVSPEGLDMVVATFDHVLQNLADEEGPVDIEMDYPIDDRQDLDDDDDENNALC